MKEGRTILKGGRKERIKGKNKRKEGRKEWGRILKEGRKEGRY